MFNGTKEFLQRNKIDLISPQTLERVGSNFPISGYVPISAFIKSYSGDQYFIEAYILNVHGLAIFGGRMSVSKEEYENALISGKKRLLARGDVEIHDGYRSHHAYAKGRIGLMIGGKHSSCYLVKPIFATAYEQKLPANDEYIRLHSRLVKTIAGYRHDLKKCSKRLVDIEARRQKRFFELEKELKSAKPIDQDLVEGIFDIVDSEKSVNNKYPPISDELEEKLLREKYAKALHWEWYPGNKGGGVGMMNGYLFTVHSDDHDKHFHVIHKEKGIDARFSFPEIKLIDYKIAKSYINSKTQKRIYKYFQEEGHFKKLADEFKKRDGAS